VDIGGVEPAAETLKDKKDLTGLSYMGASVASKEGAVRGGSRKSGNRSPELLCSLKGVQKTEGVKREAVRLTMSRQQGKKIFQENALKSEPEPPSKYSRVTSYGM